jgi:hypothetical protein
MCMLTLLLISQMTAVRFVPQPELIAAAAGIATGLIINFEEDVTSVTVVWENQLFAAGTVVVKRGHVDLVR